MSAKTKIFVIHMKELIYTGIFLLLGILLIILLVLMFHPKEKEETVQTSASSSIYEPGVYSSYIFLGEQELELAVVVESDHITSISFSNMDETSQTMYPLLDASLQSLAEQIYETQSLENLSYETEQKYTAELLISAIDQALHQVMP